MRRGALGAALLGAAACSSPGPLPLEPPPLVDLEEPPSFLEEPGDEGARAALSAGSFSGIHVGDARSSLEALLDEPEGVLVARVVENSPAEAAGVEEGDLILAATVLADGASVGGDETPLHWPSEWRALELRAPPGARVRLRLDRAGGEREAVLELVPRVHGAPREAAERLREEERVGLVVRSATEVEARAAGLGPGGGAVVVGLARGSPWRAAGIRYADLIMEVDGRPVSHPLVLLEAIRSAPEDGELALEIVREGQELALEAPVSRRATEVRRVKIPLLWSFERDRGRTEWSALLGVVRRESTKAAWDLRVLWLIRFSGGDADRLEEVER